MPKSSKRRKEKAADFSKAKLKLGKGKQTPSNAVDTSFKARSITLPSQTIAVEKSERGPTTRRKLTLEDLLAHLKHYNAGTRKDAILGLRELFEGHFAIVVTSLTPLFNGCVRLIADEDASVRKVLLAFLSWLLPRVPQDDLIPHAQLLLLFTTSALTHIFPEIRVDAVRLLDLFLEVIPAVVTEDWARGSAGHGRRVLEGYLGVLSAGTAYNETGERNVVQATSTASIVLSFTSKLVVLKSLLSFLSHALSPQTAERGISQTPQTSGYQHTPTWFMSSSFSSLSAFASFDSLLLPKHNMQGRSQVREWHTATHDNDAEHYVVHNGFALECIGDSWSFTDLGDAVSLHTFRDHHSAESSNGVKPESAYIAHLIHTLQPVLTAAFLDFAPSVFAPGGTPPETDVQTVCTVAGIVRCLYGTISSRSSDVRQDGLMEYLRTFVGHMTPYFPFNVYWHATARRDIKVEQALQELNLIFCELTSLLLLDVSSEQQTNLGLKKRHTALRQSLPIQIESVCDYVVKTLEGEALGNSVVSLARPISAASYSSILPTVWALLNNASSTHVDEVLGAVIDHAIKTSSASAVKRHTIDFLGRLLLLDAESEYHGRLQLARVPQIRKRLEEWLTQLPKILWELGAQNLALTEVILQFLLRLSQRKSAFFSKTISVSLSARFLPYFVINHSTRGRLAGPFSKLPPGSTLRTLALDVACSFCMNGSSDGFINAVREAITGNDGDYWASICASLRL